MLLGDDGVGPYVVHLLESRYEFDEGVEVVDLGTPALDLTHRIAGLDAAIFVDSVASDDPAGTVILYRRGDIVGARPEQRLDPHSPALSECLMTADMLGTAPESVLLVGVVGQDYESGGPLSADVRGVVRLAICAVLEELERLGVGFQERVSANETKSVLEQLLCASC